MHDHACRSLGRGHWRQHAPVRARLPPRDTSCAAAPRDGVTFLLCRRCAFVSWLSCLVLFVLCDPGMRFVLRFTSCCSFHFLLFIWSAHAFAADDTCGPPLFATRLSQPLVSALFFVVTHVRPLRLRLQRRVLDLVSRPISRQPYEIPGAPAILGMPLLALSEGKTTLGAGPANSSRSDGDIDCDHCIVQDDACYGAHSSCGIGLGLVVDGSRQNCRCLAASAASQQPQRPPPKLRRVSRAPRQSARPSPRSWPWRCWPRLILPDCH